MNEYESKRLLGSEGVTAGLEGVEHSPLVGGHPLGKCHPVHRLQGGTSHGHFTHLEIPMLIHTCKIHTFE